MWKSASSWKFRRVSLLHPLPWRSIRSRIWMWRDERRRDEKEKRWETGDHLTIWHGDKWGPGDWPHLGHQDINREQTLDKTQNPEQSYLELCRVHWEADSFISIQGAAEEARYVERREDPHNDWHLDWDGVMPSWSEITSSQYPDDRFTEPLRALWVPSSQHYRQSPLSEGLMMVSRWSQDRSLQRSPHWRRVVRVCHMWHRDMWPPHDTWEQSSSTVPAPPPQLWPLIAKQWCHYQTLSQTCVSSDRSNCLVFVPHNNVTLA